MAGMVIPALINPPMAQVAMLKKSRRLNGFHLPASFSFASLSDNDTSYRLLELQSNCE
jgi:hypothetical protein